MRGNVLDEPGRLALLLNVWRWKLGVRRIVEPVGVLNWTPSQLSRDCMEPCFESALRLDGLLPPEAAVLVGAEGLRSCRRKDPSPSLTELSGVPPEKDERIGVLRTVFSRTLVMGPAAGRECRACITAPRGAMAAWPA